MNVRTGWVDPGTATGLILPRESPQTLAWEVGVDGDKPCLVVTDYEANVVYHFCDDCSPLLSTTFRSVPCCEKSIRCIVVPLPEQEAGNE